MKARSAAVNRRASNRPTNGTTALCPKCSTHNVEFNERYRLPNAKGIVVITPAWICESPACGYHLAVRNEHDLLENARRLRVVARELRAKARRRLMKSRSVRERANRTLSKSVSHNR
jgi:C4-type Zn-finger protein